MTWVDEELTPPGRIYWLLGVLDHDLTNGDLAMPADELARRYVEDVTWLLGELDAYVAAYRDLTQIARDANATLAAVGEAARRMAADHAREHDSPARHSRHDRESVSSAGRGNPPDPYPGPPVNEAEFRAAYNRQARRLGYDPVPASPPEGGEGR